MFSGLGKIFRLVSQMIILSLFIGACNNASHGDMSRKDSLDSVERQDPATTVQPNVTEDTGVTIPQDTASMVTVDTPTINTPDTFTMVNPEPAPSEPEKRSATLGISFYKKMRLEETKILTVYVSIKNGHAQLVQEIRRAEAAGRVNMQEDDTTMVITRDIDLYDRLTVNLAYDTSDFRIEPIHRLATQKIDSVRTTEWKWRVKAISTDQRSSTITVKIDPEPAIEGVDDLRTTEIKVKIEFSFWDMVRSWIVFLGRNPQWTLTTLIIPIVIWIFKRRKKNNTPPTEPAE